MDQLLKKFEKIEINHSSCLEKEDQEFCEKQQQIYECVLRHFRAMFRGMKMLHDKETAFHSKLGEENVSPHNIYHKDLIMADANTQMELITSIHQELVKRIFTYFHSRYGLDLSAGAYEKYILIQKPEKPDFSFESSASYFSEEGRRERKEKRKQYEVEYQAYQEEMLLHSKLDYHVIIDDIFLYLEGFDFKEKLHLEIKQEVEKAMKNRNYKISNAKISFTGLTFARQDYKKRYEILLGLEQYKSILRVLTYYDSEQQEKNIYPDWEKRFFMQIPVDWCVHSRISGAPILKYRCADSILNGALSFIMNNETRSLQIEKGAPNAKILNHHWRD